MKLKKIKKTSQKRKVQKCRNNFLENYLSRLFSGFVISGLFSLTTISKLLMTLFCISGVNLLKRVPI